MMIKFYRVAGLFAAMLLSASVYAGDIKVEGAWSRATAPGQDAAKVELSITSKQAGNLIGAASPVSGSVELHAMTHDNGMMKMREVQAIALPAGKLVDLGAAGYHLMLIGLKAPLNEGDRVPLTLNVQLADKSVVKVDAVAEVKALTQAATQSGEHMHHHHH